MAEVAVIKSERAEGPEPDSDTALFHRKIEFHLARKPFTGFGNNSINGFKLVTLNPNQESHKASGSGNKSEKSSELSETRLDPELSFEITFRRIGAGLRNLGNTCYLNSVLQCLTYTEPLAAYLQSGKHQNSCRTSGFCALCAIQKHVSRALQSSGRILEPKDLVSNLRCISRSFRNARQEDAHEYMVNLLEKMHKCCLPSGVPSESPGAYEKSLVHKIFGGHLRSQVKCMQCSHCSNTYDPFLDLSLEIVRADSLLKALAHFTAKELLDGGGKHYQCQQCKQKVKAFKQLTVHKAPHVLTVHLKRFSSHSPGRKIDKKIAFGPTLDLKPFVTGPYEGGLNYTLYGVLVHAGWNTHSGHYYCFVRTSSGMWYTLDDNQVYQVSEKKVLDQKAYMLFYVRDRKNFIMKKPVDVIPKENMVLKAIGNEGYSKHNLEMKDKIRNGTIDKNIDDSSLATSSAQKIPSQNEIKTISVDHNSHKRGPHSENASLVPLSNAPLMDHSTKNINSVHHKRSLDLTVGTPFDTLNLSDAPRNVTGNNSSRVVGSLCKMDETSSETYGKKIKPMDTVAEASNKVNNVKSSLQSIIEEEQVGGSSREIGDSTIKVNHENTQLMIATAKHSSRGELKKKKPQLKVKRKVFKNHIPSMSLSSNIIYGVQKKKNLKQRKGKKKSRPTAEDDFHSDPGPSSTDSLLPQKKKSECGSDDKSQNLSDKNIRVSSDVINNELTKRIVNAATHSVESLPQKNQSEAQTDVMSLLTRGFEETTVARWDGINVTNSERFATRAEKTTVQIGYVGDDWDEEYDRGKRKKVRAPKVSFDGPNPFQEIATQNSKRKRTKLNRAENQPFRI